MAAPLMSKVQLGGIGVTLATRNQTPVFVNAVKTAVAPAPKKPAEPAAAAIMVAPIQNIRVIDPSISIKISGIPSIWYMGFDRSQIQVPIAPSSDFPDTAVLEDAKDPSKKFFIMGYRVVEEATTKGNQFAVRMLPKGQGWELSVTISKAAPDAILQANPGAQELPHEISLLLRYKQRVNGQPSAVAETGFTVMSVAGEQIRALLSIEGMSRRDEIYHALTDPELGCSLIVRRKTQVGIPIAVANAKLAKPLYRETERVLDLSLPFTFTPSLHPYVFEGMGAVAAGSNQGLLRKQIAWNGQHHVYYQDGGARNLFYYLPDTFKLARRPAAPHQPLMSVRFDSEDGSREKMSALLTYCAVPVVNRDRLAAAVQSMTAMVPPEILAAAGGIALEPLLPDPAKIKLGLSYPGADVQGGPFAARPQAGVDLRAGIVDAIAMTLDQFRAVYDAMFSDGQLLMSGSVAFDMGGVGEEIPFQLRFSDTAEPFAAWTAAVEGDALMVKLTNEIESPLRIHRLDGIASAANTLSVVPLEAVDSAFPVMLDPSKTAAFRLPQPAGRVLADLDLSDARAVPDKQKIYNLILDPSTRPVYLRDLKVKTFKPTFDIPIDPSQSQVMAVIVDFDDGTTVELTADQLEADVKIPMPVGPFILGAPESLTYRYRVSVARARGPVTVSEWQTGDSGRLIPTVNPV